MKPPDLLINVKDGDIRGGERWNVCRCPVARAAARALDIEVTAGEVTVDESTIEVWRGDGWDVYEFPRSVERWIEAYDAGAAVEPVTFTATWQRFTEE